VVAKRVKRHQPRNVVLTRTAILRRPLRAVLGFFWCLSKRRHRIRRGTPLFFPPRSLTHLPCLVSVLVARCVVGTPGTARCPSCATLLRWTRTTTRSGSGSSLSSMRPASSPSPGASSATTSTLPPGKRSALPPKPPSSATIGKGQRSPKASIVLHYRIRSALPQSLHRPPLSEKVSAPPKASIVLHYRIRSALPPKPPSSATIG
jgi:hypothetical protein